MLVSTFVVYLMASSRDVINVINPFIAITPRSILTSIYSNCLGLINGSNSSA